MRTLLVFLAGAVLGAPVGAFLWYAFSPLLFDDVVSENLTAAQVLSQGTFSDADAAHQGSGNVQLVALPSGALEVQLTEFEVTNGPDLEVWLSSHPDPKSSSDVSGGAWLSLGQLKGNIGNQAYAVPTGTDLSAYQSVVIWCEQFGVLFSPAPLAPAT